MKTAYHLLESFGLIWADMAPYMFLGLLIAFIFSYFTTEERIQRHLKSTKLSAIIKASLIGVPIPFCSCGVLPVALALKNGGAHRGTVIAFLSSTPQSGTDALPLAWKLFGLPFILMRLVSAVLTGLVCGWWVSQSEEPTPEVTPVNDNLDTDCAAVCCCHHHTAEMPHKPAEPHHHEYVSRRQRFKDAARYAFCHLPQEIGPLLIVGLICAAFIQVYLPLDGLNNLPLVCGYLVAILIGIPMYACSVAIVPITFTLVQAGLSIGAAYMLMVTASSMSLISLLIIAKAFGRRTLIRYVVGLTSVVFLFAITLDSTPRAWWIHDNQSTLTSHSHEHDGNHSHHHEGHSHTAPWQLVSSGAFALLIGTACVKRLIDIPRKIKAAQ